MLRDQRALVADQRAQERPRTTPRRQPVIASDYLHTTHPDTGHPVVFVPGEALPDWATRRPAPQPAVDGHDDDAGAPPPTPPAPSTKRRKSAKDVLTDTEDDDGP